MSAPDLGELRAKVEAAILAVTNAWDEPLDEVHDVPPITNAIIALALPAILDDLEAAREEIATLTAQRDRAERRHERLELGVEALAVQEEWNVKHGVDVPLRGHHLRALLAETTASEERA